MSPISSSNSASQLTLELVLDQVKVHLSQFDHASTDPATTSTLCETLERTVSSTIEGSLENTSPSLPWELLLTLSELLRIPKECIAEQDELDANELLIKNHFTRHTSSLLRLSSSLVNLLSDSDESKESIHSRAESIFIFARFTHLSPLDHSYLTSESIEYAQSICTTLLAPSSVAIVTYILSTLFPPLFKPHPNLNPDTGRVLNRPRGGENAILDRFDQAQEWRNEVGIWNVWKVCLKEMNKEDIERNWHLVIPPLLNYLDDYSPNFKLIGVELLKLLLEKLGSSNSDLLIRTGLGKVFESSLHSCLSTTSSPIYSPTLLQNTHPTSLLLIAQIHPRRTQQSTESLIEVLKLGVIRIWEFHPTSIPFRKIVLSVLPDLLQALGTLTTTRFLPILLPNLLTLFEHHSGLLIIDDRVAEMWEANLEVLKIVLTLSELRMREVQGGKKWRDKVLIGCCKAWVLVKESHEMGTERRGRLEELMRDLFAMIAGEKEKAKLKELDAQMFEGLLK